MADDFTADPLFDAKVRAHALSSTIDPTTTIQAADMNQLRQILLHMRADMSPGKITATGSTTARTLADRAADTFNVLDFGADRTGSVDSQPAIQAAINAATLVRGKVFMPAGTYAIYSPIQMQSYVTLEGAGKGLTILQQSGTIAAWAAQSAFGVIWTSGSTYYDRIVLRDFKIQGLYTTPILDTSGGPYAKQGITLQYVQRSRIERVATSDTAKGIVISGAIPGLTDHQNVIIDSDAINALSWESNNFNDRPRGFYINSPGLKMFRNHALNCVTGYLISGARSDLDNNVAEVTGTPPYGQDNGYYYGSDYGKLTNNHATGINGSGFAVAYQYNMVVQGNHAMNCQNYGFRLHAPASYVQLIGNEAIGCGIGFGVDTTSHTWPTDKMRGWTITGNIAMNSNQQGYSLRWMEDSSFVGNVALNNNQTGVTLGTRGGIQLGAYFLNNEVSGNIAQDSQGSPTQLFGLYSQPASESGASQENTGNRIRHQSNYGTDSFRRIHQRGTVTATTMTSGTKSVSAQVTFPVAFDSAPTVQCTIVNGNAFNGNERPISCTVRTVTATSFYYVIDAAANLASSVAPIFNWDASVE